MATREWLSLTCKYASALSVKESPIHGQGAFAGRPFHAGEVISKISGDKSEHPKDGEGICLGEEDFLVSKDKLSPANYVNHSCEPNAKVDGSEPVLVAVKDIKAGDEVTTDYTSTSPKSWKMKCLCKTRSCRGVIEGLV